MQRGELGRGHPPGLAGLRAVRARDAPTAAAPRTRPRTAGGPHRRGADHVPGVGEQPDDAGDQDLHTGLLEHLPHARPRRGLADVARCPPGSSHAPVVAAADQSSARSRRGPRRTPTGRRRLRRRRRGVVEVDPPRQTACRGRRHGQSRGRGEQSRRCAREATGDPPRRMSGGWAFPVDAGRGRAQGTGWSVPAGELSGLAGREAGWGGATTARTPPATLGRRSRPRPRPRSTYAMPTAITAAIGRPGKPSRRGSRRGPGRAERPRGVHRRAADRARPQAGQDDVAAHRDGRQRSDVLRATPCQGWRCTSPTVRSSSTAIAWRSVNPEPG